jgi:hypothetical protein
MEGLDITREGAILRAEFFINSTLCFDQRKLGFGRSQRVYDSLKEPHFIKKKNRFNSRTNLLGEIDAITIDKRFNPSIQYHPVEWVEGKKQYRSALTLPLTASDEHAWFKFLLDADERKDGYRGFCLYLPERVYLEKQTC